MLEIGVWVIGLIALKVKESMQVDTLGQYPRGTEIATLGKSRLDHENIEGSHVVDFGEGHPICVILPFMNLCI